MIGGEGRGEGVTLFASVFPLTLTLSPAGCITSKKSLTLRGRGDFLLEK